MALDPPFSEDVWSTGPSKLEQSYGVNRNGSDFSLLHIFKTTDSLFFKRPRTIFPKKRAISVFQRNDADGCVEKNLRQHRSTKKTAIENILSIQINLGLTG